MFPLNLRHGVATYDDNQETQISFPSNPLISHDLMINWKHICSINNNNKDLISLDQIKKKMEFQLSQNRSFIVLRGEPHAMTPHSLSTLPQLTSHVTNHSTGFPLVANRFTKFTHTAQHAVRLLEGSSAAVLQSCHLHRPIQREQSPQTDQSEGPTCFHSTHTNTH